MVDTIKTYLPCFWCTDWYIIPVKEYHPVCELRDKILGVNDLISFTEFAKFTNGFRKMLDSVNPELIESVRLDFVRTVKEIRLFYGVSLKESKIIADILNIYGK